MPNTLINNTQSSSTIAIDTRIVRSASAANAQGFAQVMQAFTSGSESALTKESSNLAETDESYDHDNLHESVDDSDVETKANNDQQENSSIDSADDSDDAMSKNDGQKTHTDSHPNADHETKQDGQSENTATDPRLIDQDNPDQSIAQVSNQEVDSSQVSVSSQETQAEDAAFRLLENQSDQAKMSIKGLGHALSHAADVDLAAIATNVTLGRNTDGSVPSQTQQHPQPQTNEHSAERADVPQRSERASIDVKPAQQADTIAQQNLPIESKIDQSTSDVQQVRSRRADAGIVRPDVQSATPRTHQPVSPESTTQAVQTSQDARPIPGLIRSAQANPTRPIAGVEMGSVGNQSADKQPGSLIEKMNQTELPSESRKASVMAQVQRGLASLLRSGKNDMTLKLTPGHLGEIKIRVKTDGNRIEVKFETSTREASEYLNSSAKELTASLRSKGLNLDQVHIEHADKSSTNDTAQGQIQDQTTQDHDRQRENQQNHTNSSDEDMQSIGYEEDELQDQDSIWTQLGLDAIA